jgi:hypothetical protein
MEKKGPMTAGHGDRDAVLPAADVEQGVQQSQLVAAPPAAFPGSFAAKGRSAEGLFVKGMRGGRKRVLRLYLTHGWDDVTIWKSAVSGFLILVWVTWMPLFLFGFYVIEQKLVFW